MAVPAIHPGEHIAEELRVLDMSVAEFSGKIGVPVKRTTGILDGHVAIDRSVARRLACFFDSTEEFWLNLQSRYELRTATKKRQGSRFRANTHRVRQG